MKKMKGKKLSLSSDKLLACIAVVIALSSILYSVSALDYPSGTLWSFNNQSYLNFDESISLNTTPFQGKLYDSSLVGYWNLDESSGLVAHDVFNNNGTIVGASWTEGKIGNSASFDGASAYINFTDLNVLKLSNAFTLGLWIKIANSMNTTSWTGIFGKSPGWSPVCAVGGAFNNIYFGVTTTSGTVFVLMPQGTVNTWQQIVVSYDKDGGVNNLKLYRNGVLVANGNQTGSVLMTSESWLLGKGPSYFNGTVDDIQIFNRSLSQSEIALAYALGDNSSFKNYKSYQDSISNNTMLISIDNLGSQNDTALVTCTRFFSQNKLAFHTNSSININIWTNLGKPVYTTGVWNSNNYTTTLALNSLSICELDWNPGVPPSVLNISTTSSLAGNSTIFSANWSDNRSLSYGGYIFSTNNTGQWVNSTWTAFTSNPNWANVTLTLNNTVGVNVSFREYANNTLGIWGVSGNYTIETAALHEAILSPIPSSTATTIPTTSPTTTPNATSTPTSTSDSTATGTFTTQTILIVTGVVTAVLFLVFVFFFKKGIIKIEVVNEQNSEKHEIQGDYQI